MGNYITQTDLETFLSPAQVTSLLGYGEQTMPTSKINLLISAAESEINFYLIQAGYSVPLTTVPDMIKLTCIFFVIYRLYSGNAQPIPEGLEVERQNQIQFLARLRDKKIQLEGNVQNPDSGIGANLFDLNLSNANQPPRIMSMKNLRGTFC